VRSVKRFFKGSKRERAARDADVPDPSESKPFAQGLRDDDIGVFFHERRRRVLLLRSSEIDVGLVDDDETLEVGILEDGNDVGDGDERSCRVAGRAEEDELDGRVGGERFVDLEGKEAMLDRLRKGRSVRSRKRGRDVPRPLSAQTSPPLYLNPP
jgi:hypothetical protein